PASASKKQSALRAAFVNFQNRGRRAPFEAFCRAGGERLCAHALFEVLDSHFRRRGMRGFRHWPSGFQSPAGRDIASFAKDTGKEFEYQLFLQWMTARSAEAAQKHARRSMP